MRSANAPQAGPAEFHLVVPRQPHGMHKVVDPPGHGRRRGAARCSRSHCRSSPAPAGHEVTGELGDSEPLMAIHDAINLGNYDEIIISTLPLGVSRWLKLDLVSKATGARAAGHARGGAEPRGGDGRSLSNRLGCRRGEARDLLAPGSDQPRRRLVADESCRRSSGRAARGRRSRRRRGARPASESWALDDVTLLAPVPEPGAVYAIGLNYAEHVAETGGKRPEVPIVFVKVRGSVAPPGGPIVCPEVVRRLDYEGELTIVMGRGGRDRRLLHRRRRHRARPPGPRAAVDARQGRRHVLPVRPVDHDRRRGPRSGDLRLRTWVNGELRQDSRTSDLIFGCAELVDFISETCTLRPGDLILTGTPNGVGMALDPPQFLELRRRDPDRDRAPGNDRALGRVDPPRRRCSGLSERRVDRDLDAAERARDRAVLAGVAGGSGEALLIEPRNATADGQLGRRDGRRAVALIERDLGADLELLGRVSRPARGRARAPSRSTKRGRRRSAPRDWSCRPSARSARPT